MEERTSLFLCAAQDLDTQSDPAVPRPGKDPDEAGVDRRIYHVLSMSVVVKVPLKHLKWQNRREITANNHIFIFKQMQREIYCARTAAVNWMQKQITLEEKTCQVVNNGS